MSPRPTTAQRGYDARWQRQRARFLHGKLCILCLAEGHHVPATVADHHPKSRRELLALGVPDPDADHLLRPLCARCHNRETAKHQPGGWHARPPRRRPKQPHPGLTDGPHATECKT